MSASQAASPTQDSDLFSLDFLALAGLDATAGTGVDVSSPPSSGVAGAGTVNGAGAGNGSGSGPGGGAGAFGINGDGHNQYHGAQGLSHLQQNGLAQWDQSAFAGPSSSSTNQHGSNHAFSTSAADEMIDFQLGSPSVPTSSLSANGNKPAGSRGRARAGTAKGQSTSQRKGSTSTARNSATASRTMEMEVDQSLIHTHTQGQAPAHGPGQQENLFAAFGEDTMGGDFFGLGTGGGGGVGSDGQDFDTVQAALLQQQLQSIHMQSPLGFDISNPQFPLAQMFLASPSNTFQPIAQGHHQSTREHSTIGDAGEVNGLGGKWQIPSLNGGVLTPGPSGEINPQSRPDLMSPMQLEMMARVMESQNDPNILPLLSPALSQSTSTSSYASPAQQAAFGSHHNGQTGQHYPNGTQGLTKSPIEQLQEQQRQFQEQLALLQQQQLEMAATAAAVVAASTSTTASPHMSSSGPSSGHARPSTTPGMTASPQYFSPLTSPALEATNRARHAHSGSSHHYSPLVNPRQSRPPHPLSALSSPALNPVGSSGGAQQTLSPALGPVNTADMSDPEYIRALVGMFDGSVQQNDPQPLYQSPSGVSTSTAGYSTILASPALNPSLSSGTGPHRNALPHKTRPSPMLKPSNHRSHHRTPSGTAAFSQPTSPVVLKAQNQMAAMGYLPPSAIDQRLLQSNASQSTASTPSPVDLSQIMPPPPVPTVSGSKANKGVTPMTPATLMNLASSIDVNGNSGAQIPAPLPPQPSASATMSGRRQGASGSTTARGGKKAIAPATTPTPASNGTKKGKLAPTSANNGKRALAIRPQSGVGVRAATKAASAAAAAAAAALAGEPENRKTSHKAAEQKRRDSLKAGFDELRLLLPAINTEALDPESGEPIPGSSAPRLLPKSSLVPDDNPNRGVSKVALLKFSNEYIVKLHERVEKRDKYIDKLREEVRRMREGEEDEVRGEEGEDLLDIDIGEGEEDEFGPPEEDGDELPEEEDQEQGEGDDEEEEGGGGEGDMELDAITEDDRPRSGGRKRGKSLSTSWKSNANTKSPALRATGASGSGSGSAGRRPGLVKGSSSGQTVTMKSRRGE